MVSVQMFQKMISNTVSLVAAFNTVAETSAYEILSLKELTNPDGYTILCFKEVISRYGRSVRATIEVPEKGGTCCTFLTKRYSDIMTNEMIEEYNNNNRNAKLKIVFCGVSPFNEFIIKLI